MTLKQNKGGWDDRRTERTPIKIFLHKQIMALRLQTAKVRKKFLEKKKN